MDIEAEIAEKAENLRKAMHSQMRIRARSFAGAVRRAGRLLPRRLRRQADVIIQVQGVGGHPKLLRMIDRAAVDAAYADISAYLSAIDPADLRRGWWLRFAGVAVVNVLIVAVGFVVWLKWSGHI